MGCSPWGHKESDSLKRLSRDSIWIVSGTNICALKFISQLPQSQNIERQGVFTKHLVQIFLLSLNTSCCHFSRVRLCDSMDCSQV